jgi:hypothetical protein
MAEAPAADDLLKIDNFICFALYSRDMPSRGSTSRCSIQWDLPRNIW